MMTYWDRKLIREQMDSKLKQFGILRSLAMFDRGWIRAIREALDMTATDLAKKANLTQSRISKLEKAEIEGDLKLSTLRKIAESLDMTFVYGFVPRQSLEQQVQDQARKIAINRLAKLNHTMKLEDQEILSGEKEIALNDLIEKILHNPPKDFWQQ